MAIPILALIKISSEVKQNFIRRRELFLVYQPIINVATLKCEGIEALVRWKHPKYGVILPEKFLPYVIIAGKITNLGHWVMQQALTDYTKLTSLNFISVNISADEFVASKTIETILDVLKKHKLKPSNLIIEITETTIMHETLASIEKFNSLADKGVRIAVDDFGAGYSTLNALKRLKLSILKIDKSFISNIDKNSIDLILVQSTIKLAHTLGFKVVAEGVETKKQFKILQLNNCDYVQGKLFSMPLNLYQIKNFIANEQDLSDKFTRKK